MELSFDFRLMRIAYLSPSFPPLLGGMGTACYYTANEIGKNHQVTVFLAKRNVEYKKGNYKIKLIRPWLSYGHAHLMPQVLWLLKDFDIVHLYYPYFGTAEFLGLLKLIRGSKKPKVIFHHSMEAVGTGFLKYIFKFHTKFIMPILMKSVDAIFILSKDYAEHSDISKIYKKHPEKFYEAPHGVDVTKFKVKNEKLKVKENNKIIFTAQALDKQHFFKGIDVLIKAFYILNTQYSIQNAKLMIAGDGDLKKYYQNLANKIGVQDKVIFLGKVSQEELPYYYNLATITVVPSTQRTECFSIAAVESMACATPVVVTDFPGVRVTIENNKSGLVAKPNDEKDLAEKLSFFLTSPEKAKDFGNNARKRVEEKFNWQIITQKILMHYREILSLAK